MNKDFFKKIFIIIIIIIIIVIVVVVVVDDDTDYWVYLSSDHLFQVYYKVRQVLLQSATAFLLQSATSVITKCDRYYKVWQFYYKVRQVLQKWDDYYKVRQYSGLSSQLHLLAVGFYTYIQNKITYDETKTEGCEYSKGKKHC